MEEKTTGRRAAGKGETVLGAGGRAIAGAKRQTNRGLFYAIDGAKRQPPRQPMADGSPCDRRRMERAAGFAKGGKTLRRAAKNARGSETDRVLFKRGGGGALALGRAADAGGAAGRRVDPRSDAHNTACAGHKMAGFSYKYIDVKITKKIWASKIPEKH